MAALEMARERAKRRVLAWFYAHGESGDACDFLERLLGENGQARMGVLLFVSDNLAFEWMQALKRSGDLNPEAGLAREVELVLNALLQAHNVAARRRSLEGAERDYAEALADSLTVAVERTALAHIGHRVRSTRHDDERTPDFPVLVMSLSRGAPRETTRDREDVAEVRTSSPTRLAYIKDLAIM